MPGKERRKQVERERYQRQMARRMRRDERRRTIKAVVTSVIVVVLVVGGLSFAAYKLSAKTRGEQSQAGQSTSAPASTAASPSPTSTAPPGTCVYSKAQGGTTAKNVGKPPRKPKKGTYTATMRTNRGTITMRLDGDKAPCTVNSFRYLAKKGYFDHTKCHRLVTKGIHVLQCGDPTGTGRGGPGYQFGTENTNGVKYTAGTLAMANSGSPDSNGSQFFIVYKDSLDLPAQYTVFGKVTSGLGIVQKVANAGVTKTDPRVGGGPPKKPVTMKQLTVSRAQ